MPNLTPDTPQDAHVGDTRDLSFVFLKSYRVHVRDLTGYACRISFAYPDAAPHVVRSARLTPASGIAATTLQGDEYPTVGECCAHFTLEAPDWYGGNAPGRAFIRTSSPLLRFNVMRSPS